jgi:hypothetical protein
MKRQKFLLIGSLQIYAWVPLPFGGDPCQEQSRTVSGQGAAGRVKQQFNCWGHADAFGLGVLECFDVWR